MANAKTVLAYHRFGLGARPGDLDRPMPDPLEALLAEVRTTTVAAGDLAKLPSSSHLLSSLFDYREAQRLARQSAGSSASPAMSPGASAPGKRRASERGAGAMGAGGMGPGAMGPGATMSEAPQREGAMQEQAAAQRMQGPVQPVVRSEMEARFSAAAAAPVGFAERLALFWANHFTVAGINQRVRIVCGAFEREAIRPHIGGRFEDMLQAVAAHPAMLFYLDNERSIGPGSRAGQRRNKGLNENFARELLELHTVGVDAGYAQSDVTRLAEILTGWTVVGRKANGGTAGTFLFRAGMHEPGARRVMGKSYADTGVEQGRAVLSDLARHPATARHIAYKLCRHFIADVPPPGAVQRVADAFAASRGDLPTTYKALLAAPEAWTQQQDKLRTPYEFVVAMQRGLSFVGNAQRLINSLRLMGQPPFGAPSPKGWPDEAATWAAPDAIKTRLDLAEIVARRQSQADALALGRALLGPLLTNETETALRRAESRQQAVTLLMMSPEFQRR